MSKENLDLRDAQVQEIRVIAPLKAESVNDKDVTPLIGGKELLGELRIRDERDHTLGEEEFEPVCLHPMHVAKRCRKAARPKGVLSSFGEHVNPLKVLPKVPEDDRLFLESISRKEEVAPNLCRPLRHGFKDDVHVVSVVEVAVGEQNPREGFWIEGRTARKRPNQSPRSGIKVKGHTLRGNPHPSGGPELLHDDKACSCSPEKLYEIPHRSTILEKEGGVKMALRIVVLGRPGVGKTTLMQRISTHFPGLFRGFYTEEVREKGTRVGFRVVTLSGKRGMLAAKGASSPFRVGAYGVLVSEFESTVLPELEEALRAEAPCLIDELGKMEFFSEGFRKILPSLWEKAPLLLATARFPQIPEVTEFFSQKEVRSFLLTPRNREEVFAQVLEEVRAFTKGG